MSDSESDCRCPVCNARFRNQHICSRCGADLLPLMKLIVTAFKLRQLSRFCLQSGDFSAAREYVVRAEYLHTTETGKRLLCVASLLADYPND